MKILITHYCKIITNYDKKLLQITAVLLQITTVGYYKLRQALLQITAKIYYKLRQKVITNYGSSYLWKIQNYYKLQVLLHIRQFLVLLQISANFITNYGRHYKLRYYKLRRNRCYLEKRLKSCTIKIFECFHNSRFKFNFPKWNLIRTSKFEDEIQIRETSLTSVNKVKFLGIHISGLLNFDYHVSKTL